MYEQPFQKMLLLPKQEWCCSHYFVTWYTDRSWCAQDYSLFFMLTYLQSQNKTHIDTHFVTLQRRVARLCLANQRENPVMSLSLLLLWPGMKRWIHAAVREPISWVCPSPRTSTPKLVRQIYSLFIQIQLKAEESPTQNSQSHWFSGSHAWVSINKIPDEAALFL